MGPKYHVSRESYFIRKLTNLRYNVGGPDDIQELKSDADWLRRYRESIDLIALSWGWNIRERRRVKEQDFLPPKSSAGRLELEVRLVNWSAIARFFTFEVQS